MVMLTAPRNRSLTLPAIVAFALVGGAASLYAQDWQPWQKVTGTEISWHYRWNAAWGDYDIELRNGNASAVSLKFVVSCGRDTRTAFWSLQPGGVGSFLERFPSGGPAVRLSLRIVESEKQE
ncbi:MAG TPA: hypothetical protein VMU36_02270 [Spirochaetia bacterium]|nr:hypothetical protein [Spirochaetia bacterium]